MKTLPTTQTSPPKSSSLSKSRRSTISFPPSTNDTLYSKNRSKLPKSSNFPSLSESRFPWAQFYDDEILDNKNSIFKFLEGQNLDILHPEYHNFAKKQSISSIGSINNLQAIRDQNRMIQSQRIGASIFVNCSITILVTFLAGFYYRTILMFCVMCLCLGILWIGPRYFSKNKRHASILTGNIITILATFCEAYALGKPGAFHNPTLTFFIVLSSNSFYLSDGFIFLIPLLTGTIFYFVSPLIYQLPFSGYDWSYREYSHFEPFAINIAFTICTFFVTYTGTCSINRAITEMVTTSAKSAKLHSFLIFLVFPPQIASALNNYHDVVPKIGFCVCIFVKIVNSGGFGPKINHFIQNVDKYAQQFNVVKVKNNGPIFFGTTGLFETNLSFSEMVFDTVEFAVTIQTYLDNYTETTGFPLDLEVGITSGVVLHGIFGSDKFIWDVWGTPVNLASRIQSLHIQGEILTDQATANLYNQQVENTTSINQKDFQFKPFENFDLYGMNTVKLFQLEKIPSSGISSHLHKSLTENGDINSAIPSSSMKIHPLEEPEYLKKKSNHPLHKKSKYTDFRDTYDEKNLDRRYSTPKTHFKHFLNMRTHTPPLPSKSLHQNYFETHSHPHLKSSEPTLNENGSNDDLNPSGDSSIMFQKKPSTSRSNKSSSQPYLPQTPTTLQENKELKLQIMTKEVIVNGFDQVDQVDTLVTRSVPHPNSKSPQSNSEAASNFSSKTYRDSSDNFSMSEFSVVSSNNSAKASSVPVVENPPSFSATQFSLDSTQHSLNNLLTPTFGRDSSKNLASFPENALRFPTNHQSSTYSSIFAKSSGSSPNQNSGQSTISEFHSTLSNIQQHTKYFLDPNSAFKISQLVNFCRWPVISLTDSIMVIKHLKMPKNNFPFLSAESKLLTNMFWLALDTFEQSWWTFSWFHFILSIFCCVIQIQLCKMYSKFQTHPMTFGSLTMLITLLRCFSLVSENPFIGRFILVVLIPYPIIILDSFNPVATFGLSFIHLITIGISLFLYPDVDLDIFDSLVFFIICLSYLCALTWQFSLFHELVENRQIQCSAFTLSLLDHIFPKPIIQSIRLGADRASLYKFHDNITFIDIDIVNFTQFCRISPTHEILVHLSSIFKRFDSIASNIGIEKIKTLGDAWFGTLGVFDNFTRKQRAEFTVLFGLHCLKSLEQYNEESGMFFQIRVVIHSGFAYSGVLGVERISFDIWGPTVETLHLLEEVAPIGKILISEPVSKHLNPARYSLEPHIPQDRKGNVSKMDLPPSYVLTSNLSI